MPGFALTVLCVALAATGCDVAGPTPPAPPPLHLLATSPSNGEGTECTLGSGLACGVALDAPIELRFDRPLLPWTAVRQSVSAYSGSPDDAVLLVPRYDPIEWVVSLLPAGGWQPGLLYTVELPEPDDDERGWGLRAYDGAGLARGPVPLRFSFRTERKSAPLDDAATPAQDADGGSTERLADASGGASPGRPPAPTCGQILALLARAGCPRCHGSEGRAAMGLDLSAAAALQATALGRVARETETGPTTGRPSAAPARFGESMALIEPGSAGNSYLVHKLLLNPANFGGSGAACSTRYQVPLPAGTCLPPSPAERKRLREWFVRLEPMPPDGSHLESLGDLRALVDFIAAGAPLRPCL